MNGVVHHQSFGQIGLDSRGMHLCCLFCTKPRCGQPNSVRPRLTPLITAMCLKGVPKILSIRYIPLEGVVFLTRLELTDRIDLTLNIRGLSKRTVKIYKTWLTRFFDYVDVEDPSTITLYDCQKFLNHLRNDKNYAIRTHNQAVYALRHLCGTVLMIPYDKNALPRIRPPKTDKPFFSGEQVIQLIDQCEDLELKAAIALSFGCGLRIQEITNIQFRHINKVSHTITIENSKNDRTRTVKYSPSTAAILNSFFLSRQMILRPDDFLFHRKSPQCPMKTSALTQKFSHYIKGFPFSLPEHTFHSLRHSFATMLAWKNVPLPQIQKLMGHASAATTATYIHINESYLVELPDVLTRKEGKSS